MKLEEILETNERLQHVFAKARNAEGIKSFMACHEIIRELKDIFPSPYDLTDYDRTSLPYPHKKCSILELAVNTNNPEVLEQIFNKYLRDNTSATIYFLRQEGSLGQKFDFHYFQNDLPPHVRYEAQSFVDKEKAKKHLTQPDLRNDEQKKREEIYYIIRKKLVENEKNFSEGSGNSLLSDDKMRFSKDFSLMYQKTEGENKGFFWEKEKHKLSQITLRHLPDEDGGEWPNRKAVLKNLDPNSLKSFAEQAFKQIRFPELFADMSAMLNKTQEAMRKMQNDIEFHSLAASVERNAVELRLENRQDKDMMESNYGGYHYSQQNLIVLNGESLGQSPSYWAETIKHEAAHAVDALSDDTQLTDSGLYTFSVCAAIDNRFKNVERARIIRNVKEYYTPDAFTKEVMARVKGIALLRFLQCSNGKESAPMANGKTTMLA